MSKNLFITLGWDKSYTLLVAPVSGRFAVDQNHVGYELRPATTEALGGVIVGDNLVVDDAGRISATGSGVAGVSSFNNRVGAITLIEKDISDALGFRPVQYKLPVATDKTLGGVKQGKNVTIAEDGALSVADIPEPYKLPIAAKDALGGIKVGRNLAIDEDGTLNAADTPQSGVTSFNGRKGDVKLTKKDVTDVVDIPSPYDLPIASEKTLGGIKVGYNLLVEDDGTLNALDQKYTLPPATTKDLGGIIVGDNLTIDENGRLSAIGGDGGVVSFNGRSGRVNLTSKDVEEVQLIASKKSLGVVKVGRNLTINPDGTLDADDQGGGTAGVVSFNGRKGEVTLSKDDVLEALPIASERSLGGVKVGDNLTIDKDGRLNAQGGGGQGASHRLIWSDDDADEWTNYALKKSDINGYISVVTDTYIPAALVLPLDVYGSPGCVIEITNLNGDVGIFGADANNIIYNRDYYNMVKEYGTAKLIYIGEDVQSESGLNLKSVSNGQKFWMLIGDLTDERAYKLSKPSIKSAIGGESSITVVMNLPQEKIPVMGYDFDAVGSDGSWKHYSFRNDGLGQVVLDGLTNQVEYTITFHTFATCGTSPESDPVKVKPTGRRPDAPTLVKLEGHWNGAKAYFNEPADKTVNITGWVVKDEDGKIYPLENVDGKPGQIHTGWFGNLTEKTWNLAIAGKNENGVGEFSAVGSVYIGAGQFTPNQPFFQPEANLGRTVLWNMRAGGWGLEDGYTSLEVVATDLDGTSPDIVETFKATDTSGWTGKLDYEHKYNLAIRAVYPNGKTKLCLSSPVTMWPHYIKEAPKSVTVDATKTDAIYVTVNDACKPPCTGFEVWIDGHPIVAQESIYGMTCKVTKGYSKGAECLVQVRWIEIDNQFSDLDTGNKVTPAAPSPDVPDLGLGAQFVNKVSVPFKKNTSGAEATNYYLMYRNVGDTNWMKIDVTADVLAKGVAQFQPLVSQSTVQVQYCGSAKNSAGESMFSIVRTISCDPYTPSDSPSGNGVAILVADGNLTISIDPSGFATNDQHRHFSGIIMKYSVNGGAPQTLLKPTDWKGSSGDWYGANKGDTLSVCFAAQTWGSVEGRFSSPIPLLRT